MQKSRDETEHFAVYNKSDNNYQFYDVLGGLYPTVAVWAVETKLVNNWKNLKLFTEPPLFVGIFKGPFWASSIDFEGCHVINMTGKR